jgi:hypothetical protein
MQLLKDVAQKARFAAMQPAAVDRRQDTIVATWQANGRNWRELRVWSNGRFAYFTQWEFQPGVWA